MAREEMDSYRLTSMEEPSDEMLAQLMADAAEEVKRTNDAATADFFAQLRKEARTINVTW